jgi:dolichyl-phosphate-mannose-protein mannosyltransferase
MSTVASADQGRTGPERAAHSPLDRPITQHLRRWQWLYLLLGVSMCLHFWRLGEPADVLFDESLVGEFASHYLTGTYYFDIHPPHLKLIYALIGRLGGWTAAMGFPAVGQAYTDGYYLAMRAFPALCGSLLPVIAVLLALELRATLIWALVCGWAVLLDSALMAESRFILNDIPLLFFGSAGWWCLLRWRHTRSTLALAGAALLLGLAVCVKWTGICFVGPALVALALDRRSPAGLRQRLAAIAFIVATSAAMQLAGFEIHLSLLTRSGPGDSFMSKEFQKRLTGSAYGGDPGVVALNDAQAIVELNQTMARYASKVASHPYSSPWFSWPAGWRGIYFWTDGPAKNGSEHQSRIYMLPNLAVWWLGLFAVVRLMALLLPRLVAAGLRRPHAPIEGPELLIAFSYFCCLAPFAAIDRPMFLYHYFPALLCSLLAGAVQARSITRPLPVAIALVTSFALVFAWMSPLVYGEPLTSSQYSMRMLMKAWP